MSEPQTTPPKTRKTPETIHTWLREQGEHHVEAAAILGKDFVKRLREEREYQKARTEALMRVMHLTNALAEAQTAAKAFPAEAPRPEQDKLERLAKTIAVERGEVPAADESTTTATE